MKYEFDIKEFDDIDKGFTGTSQPGKPTKMPIDISVIYTPLKDKIIAYAVLSMPLFGFAMLVMWGLR